MRQRSIFETQIVEGRNLEFEILFAKDLQRRYRKRGRRVMKDIKYSRGFAFYHPKKAFLIIDNLCEDLGRDYDTEKKLLIGVEEQITWTTIHELIHLYWPPCQGFSLSGEERKADLITNILTDSDQINIIE